LATVHIIYLLNIINML